MAHLEEQQTQLLVLWNVVYKEKIILGVWISSDFEKKTDVMLGQRGLW